MPSNKSPGRGLKNTLNALISSFRGVGYKMLSKDEDFWLS